MTDDAPPACSLGAGDLQRRLATIAELGARSLIERRAVDGRNVLRFRDDPGTREGLEGVLAAEALCCPFLDLALRRDGAELLVEIGAPGEGRALADELAAAFGQ